MKKLVCSMIVMAVMSSAVCGGELNTKTGAGVGAWVAHIDIEPILGSKLGKTFLAKAEEKEKFAKGIAAMKEKLGIDPLNDIRGITMYGPEFGEHAGVAVIDATVAADKLTDIIKEKDGYKTEKHGDHVVHQWTDKRHDDKAVTMYGCFYDNKTVAIGTSLKLLTTALDVLDGEAESLAKTNAIESLPEPAKGTFVVMATDKLKLPAGKAPQAAILKRVTAASLQAGESRGSVFLSVCLTAGDAEDAANMRMIAQGSIALFQIMRQQEKFADLQDLGEKIQVAGEGREVRLDASIPVESLLKVLEFVSERRDRFGPRKHRQRGDDRE